MDGRSSVRSVDGSNDELDWLRRHCNSTDEAEVTAPAGESFGFSHRAAAAEEGEEAAIVEPSSPATFLPPLPQRVEPTLKERLVERERQARVETERARLKRQFALSSNGGAVEESGADDLHATREHGSVVGTVGEESSVAAHALEEDPGTETGTNEPLGYAMERFLADRNGAEGQDRPAEEVVRETGVIMERFLADPVVVDATVHVPVDEVPNENPVIPNAEAPREVRHDADDPAGHPSSSSSPSSTGDDPVAGPAEMNVAADTAPHAQELAGVEDHLEPLTRDSDINATVGSIRSYSTASGTDVPPVALVDNNVTPTRLDIEPTHSRGHMSLQSVESQDGSNMGDDTEIFTIPSQELGSLTEETPPRVFRLTEAEIQEMASIEEASIGNAPPSERGESFSESSLVGDMVAEFGGGIRDLDVGTMSERTQTTALESVSVTDNQSGIDAQETAPTQDSIDDIVSTSSHHHLSAGGSTDGSIASVTAMPPSLSGEPSNDDPHQSSIRDEDMGSPTEENHVFMDLGSPSAEQHQSHATVPSRDEMLDAVASAALNAGVVNRTIRPGRVRTNSAGEATLDEASASGIKRSSSTPLLVDGFDFNKYDPAPMSPLQSGLADSFGDLPGDDIWSPRGKMLLSPLRLATASSEEQEPQQAAASQLSRNNIPPVDQEGRGNLKETGNQYKDYGSAPLGLAQLINRRHPPQSHLSIDRITEETERRPLLQTRDVEGFSSSRESSEHTLLSSVFSSVRSDSTATIEEEINESDVYLASSVLARAFPERFFALLVTLIVEIPTVMMISGGSDRLCMLIGRSRYQLMMAFLPLSSAISGNVGLQASTLTTRAISHRHVTKDEFWKWFLREVGAAAYLGFGMGVIIGSVAFVASNYDAGFGFTIFMAQQISILTAGLTGTFAPLLFSFIFHRDSGKWGGPLETAVQDIVGSFAMVVMSYRILLYLGPAEVEPGDSCGGGQF